MNKYLLSHGVIALVSMALILTQRATALDIAGPSGSGLFGQNVVVLPNGNFVVTDFAFDAAGAITDVGAVYLYSPSGTLISTLKGSVAGDLVGSRVTVLSNGNFVVQSIRWANGGSALAGAVTWGSGATGFPGGPVVTVSSSNSMVGSSTNDQVGSGGVKALTNGNYAILSPAWNGAVSQVGAVTWGNGTTGTSGTVSSANSLVGSTASDAVGAQGVTALTNGNYVVTSINWDNGSIVNAGAVTWGSGTTGVSGVVSGSNSLVGTTTNDRVGYNGVTALANGNYVVCTSVWNQTSPVTVGVGAATWGNGTTGVSGSITSVNSLIGTKTNDFVGGEGCTALPNGNYVVCSPRWSGPTPPFVGSLGAVTWGNGTTGISGTPTAVNSMVGTKNQDRVGDLGVAVLSTGHYVIRSSSWEDDSVSPSRFGAVTWCNGNTGGTGTVSTANSVVGTVGGDDLNRSGITPLTNGHYVVTCPAWKSGTKLNVGAVMWLSGTGPSTGEPSADNAIVGTVANDFVGREGVTALTNGNYVIASKRWNGNRGAVTWCQGAGSTAGPINAGNSLVGTTANDFIGEDGVTALTNGNYVVASHSWRNGTLASAGAVTWGSGTAGVKGTVSATNSLIGTTAGDIVGFGAGKVVAIPNGNYLVCSPSWNNTTPVTNDPGAVTFGAGASGTVGTISAANSFIGPSAGSGSSMVFAYNSTNDRVVIGLPAINQVSLFGPPGKVGVAAPVFAEMEPLAPTPLNIVLQRTGGSSGSVSVTVSTTPGTATADADYTAISGQTVTFSEGETSKMVQVTLLPGNAVNEANETFFVKLTGADVLPSASTCTVRIIDSGDTTLPGAPAFTAPAADARIGLAPGSTVTVTGTAKDDRGVADVQVSLNGGTFVSVDEVTSLAAPSVTWTMTLTPVTGVNSLQARSVDTNGNVGTIFATRSFVVTRPLIVNLNGSGSVTKGFAPNSFREVNKPTSINATPAPNFIFTGWAIAGPNTASQIGVDAAALQRPVLNFVFKESLQLTANFVANPYLTAGIAGIYNGSITADPTQPDFAPAGASPGDGTKPSASTEGSITVTVSQSGAFTGKINMDGLSLPIAGTFDEAGNARFGVSRGYYLSIPRAGKTTLLATFSIDITGPDYGRLAGYILDQYVAGSNITATRSHWNGTTLVPTDLLRSGNANGVFNVMFQNGLPASQPPGLTATDYPQGFSPAVITVTKAGAVSIAGTLSDGTSFTASGTLDQTKVSSLYISLYGKRGYVRGDLIFDTAQTTVDVFANFMTWLRPVLDDQHYPNGWPNGLVIHALGTKFTPPTNGTSVLPGLTQSATEADGNATLSFVNGTLPTVMNKTLGITSTDVVTALPADASFTLTLTRNTGKLKGSFTLGNTKPNFQGIILNKGPTKMGFGFFKTVSPKVKDYNGQGGAVQLLAQ